MFVVSAAYLERPNPKTAIKMVEGGETLKDCPSSAWMGPR
jgi:hypothetical protein